MFARPRDPNPRRPPPFKRDGRDTFPGTLATLQQFGEYRWGDTLLPVDASNGALAIAGTTGLRFAEQAATATTTEVEECDAPGVADWCWPPRDQQAIEDSLFGQTSKMLTPAPPSKTKINKLVNETCKRYPKSAQPSWMDCDKIDLIAAEKRLVQLAADVVNLKAGPGVPLVYLSPENKVLLATNFPLVRDAVLERLQLLGTRNLDRKAETPISLVKQGFVDPVRVFVKNEPHNKKKKADRRWRLIMSVSLVDQLVERLLFENQNNTEIKNWTTCPSKPGFGLASDTDLCTLKGSVMGFTHGDINRAAEADVSGWDWSVQEWELLADAECRIRLMDASPLMARIIRNRVLCLSRSVYVTPKGVMYAQLKYGIQLSGLSLIHI